MTDLLSAGLPKRLGAQGNPDSPPAAGHRRKEKLADRLGVTLPWHGPRCSWQGTGQEADVSPGPLPGAPGGASPVSVLGTPPEEWGGGSRVGASAPRITALFFRVPLGAGITGNVVRQEENVLGGENSAFEFGKGNVS